MTGHHEEDPLRRRLYVLAGSLRGRDLWNDIRTIDPAPPKATPSGRGVAWVVGSAAALVTIGLLVLMLRGPDTGAPAGTPSATSPSPTRVLPANGAIAFVEGREVTAYDPNQIPRISLQLVDPARRSVSLLDPEVGGQSPTWSPDGTSIAYVSVGGLEILDVPGGDVGTVEVCPDPECSVEAPAWSPDGRTIAFGSDRDGPALWAFDLVTGGLRVMADDISVVGAPSWSPDGTRLAVVGSPIVDARVSENRVMILDAATGELISELEVVDDALAGGSVAWSPSGETLALGLNNNGDQIGGIYISRADGTARSLVSTCPRDTCIDRSPVWSPDGTKLAFIRAGCQEAGGDCYYGDVMIVEVSTGEISQVAIGGRKACCLAWQPLP